MKKYKKNEGIKYKKTKRETRKKEKR